MYSESIKKKLRLREESGQLRSLMSNDDLSDWCSNDYLGLAYSTDLAQSATNIIKNSSKGKAINGATGSRLISGNHHLYKEAEQVLVDFYRSPSALIFNSGYDANIGFWSAVPQRGEVVLYDEYIHASIRDGMRLSLAKAYKFGHNDISDLARLLERNKSAASIYVVTESIFSMDGDQPDLLAFVELCQAYNAYLVVDEAHAVGVIGDRGEGLVAHLGIEEQVFARLVTFGKAWGSHGAAILGGEILRTYLINFARSFIYTTGLTPHTLATIIAAHQLDIVTYQKKLQANLAYFRDCIAELPPKIKWIDSNSPIQSCVISGEREVRQMAAVLQSHNYFVKAILSPTVPKGQERLRICIHATHTFEQIRNLIKLVLYTSLDNDFVRQ